MRLSDGGFALLCEWHCLQPIPDFNSPHQRPQMRSSFLRRQVPPCTSYHRTTLFMRRLFKLLLLLGSLKLFHLVYVSESPPNRTVLGLVRKYSKTQLVWLTRYTGVPHPRTLSFSKLCWAFFTSVGMQFLSSNNGYKSRSTKTKEPNALKSSWQHV